MSETPANWGDWRPCKICKTLQPPKTLDADGCCIDKIWCARVRHFTPKEGNGSSAIPTWGNEAPIAEAMDKMLWVNTKGACPPDPEPAPKKTPKKQAKRCKKKQKK